ncbi:hypothetical protein ACA910_009256 [Epithemia clementina (nom. ined.)]
MTVSMRSFLAVLAMSSSTTTTSVLGFTPTSGNRNDRFAAVLKSHPKNSDRAHIERNLEEAMDNDWRVFRAKLVAKEKLETQRQVDRKQSSMTGGNSSNSKLKTAEENDQKLQRQAQLGDLFAGALSSIFKSKAPPEPSSETSIFAGDLVGGAHFIPRPEVGRSRVDGQDGGQGSQGGIVHEDPFVSEAELPLLLPETTIDKHRWAHEIPHVEPGCVLIANEKLGGVFHQTVVLVIEHHESSGTFGVVINRPMEGDLRKVASNPKSKLDLSLKMAFHNSKVAYGGPVLTDEFSVLHSFGEVEGARKLCSGVYIGGSEELMMQVRLGAMDPSRALFVKGHAAWVPGQLNREIQKGVWYTAAVSSDFILRYAGVELTPDDNPNDLWTDILSCIGGKFEEIARRHGGTGDSRRVMP